MFFAKKEPDTRCKVNAILRDVNQEAIKKMKNGNNNLTFKGQEVYYKNKKIGTLSDKNCQRIQKLENLNYFYTIYDVYENLTETQGEYDPNQKPTGKGITLKFY